LHADKNGNDDELDMMSPPIARIKITAKKKHHAKDASKDKYRSTGKEENAEISDKTPKTTTATTIEYCRRSSQRQQ